MAWKRFEIFLIQTEYHGCLDYRPFLIINPFDGAELRGYFISGTEDLHAGSVCASAYNFRLLSYHEDFAKWIGINDVKPEEIEPE